MKTRNSFVSNSSSSSFILALKDKKTRKITVHLEVNLDELTDRIISKPQELEEAWLSDYGYDDIDELFEDYGENYRKRYEKCLEALEQGKTIMMGSVSNEDYNPLSMLLYDRGIAQNIEEIKTGNIEVIQDCAEGE